MIDACFIEVRNEGLLTQASWLTKIPVLRCAGSLTWGNEYSMVVKNLKAVEQEMVTWGTTPQCLTCSGAQKKEHVVSGSLFPMLIQQLVVM